MGALCQAPALTDCFLGQALCRSGEYHRYGKRAIWSTSNIKACREILGGVRVRWVLAQEQRYCYGGTGTLSYILHQFQFMSIIARRPDSFFDQ